MLLRAMARAAPRGTQRTSDWLFTAEEGEPCNYPMDRRMEFLSSHAPSGEEQGAEHEGCKPAESPHRVTHNLRHFYASALIAGGASVKQGRLVLGRVSAVITLRIYAHTVVWKRRPHPVRHGRRARRPADRVRTGRKSDQRNRRSEGLTRDQAFLVSQKILSISPIRSRAFWPVAGSFDALAAESAFRVSLTSWWSWGYFSKCGALK